MVAPVARIMDWNFNLLAYIDSYQSLRFERKLWEIGGFELSMYTDRQGADSLQPGHLMYLDKDRIGIIESVEQREENGGVHTSAAGTELKGIASRRIVLPSVKDDQTFFGWDRYPNLDDPDAPAESVIKHYAGKHLVAPENENRKIPRLLLARDQRRGTLMRWQSRFQGLHDTLAAIGEYAGMGYIIRASPEKALYEFDVIPARDRTAGSDLPVIFSSDWGNLSDTVYTVDLADWKNAGYAAGAGEDENRLILTVYPDGKASGLQRRETFVDCGSLEDAGELELEATHKMKEMVRIQTLTGQLFPAGPFLYRKDWDIGDRVTVQSNRMGVSADMLITEVCESYEADTFRIDITFDKRKKTLLDEIRKKEVVR